MQHRTHVGKSLIASRSGLAVDFSRPEQPVGDFRRDCRHAFGRAERTRRLVGIRANSSARIRCRKSPLPVNALSLHFANAFGSLTDVDERGHDLVGRAEDFANPRTMCGPRPFAGARNRWCQWYWVTGVQDAAEVRLHMDRINVPRSLTEADVFEPLAILMLSTEVMIAGNVLSMSLTATPFFFFKRADSVVVSGPNVSGAAIPPPHPHKNAASAVGRGLLDLTEQSRWRVIEVRR